jgi:hypothetical protein
MVPSAADARPADALITALVFFAGGVFEDICRTLLPN